MTNEERLQTFIVEYSTSDGCTYTYDFVVPAKAVSQEALLEEFELCLAAYDPEKNNREFKCGGRTFDYNHFIFWMTKGNKQIFDYVLPMVTLIDEWVERELK